MGHTWKNGSQLEKWVTLVKTGRTCKNGSHLEKRVTLVKMGHTLKNGRTLKKWATLRKMISIANFFSITIFLPRVLMYQKRQISLPVG